MAAGSNRHRSGPLFPSADYSGLRGWLASCFILSVLLGLVFRLSSAAYKVEVKARCAAVNSDVVGGAALVVLMHLKVSVSPLSPLRRADMDWGLVAMWSGKGIVLAPLLVPPLSLLPPTPPPPFGWMARRCCSPHVYVDGES
jgi:hypothetical protein